MIGFFIGLAIGGVGMLLIYRNNLAQMSKIADKLNEKIAELKEEVKEEEVKK